MKPIFVVAVIASAVLQVHATVNVTLYYESLCSDTINFFRYQLWPTYRALGDNLKIEFVPFGKAWWSENPWSITCQHGARECHGNAIQACALERYTKPEEQVKFISCVMMEPRPDQAGLTCAQWLGYNYSGIEKCAAGEEGRQLHIKHGRRTKSFRPAITFIPTIAFNDIYDANDHQQSLNQFKRVVCSKFPRDQIPRGCFN